MMTEKCADENGACNCSGTVHYGRADKNQDFATMTKKTFRSMKMSEHSEHFVNGFVGCNNNVFDDPSPGKKKQCFCERPKPPAEMPKKENLKQCGYEKNGDSCTCQGTVFYGRENENKTREEAMIEYEKTNKTAVPLTLEEMFKFPFAQK